jgi:hypothetical protein
MSYFLLTPAEPPRALRRLKLALVKEGRLDFQVPRTGPWSDVVRSWKLTMRLWAAPPQPWAESALQ